MMVEYYLDELLMAFSRVPHSRKTSVSNVFVEHRRDKVHIFGFQFGAGLNTVVFSMFVRFYVHGQGIMFGEM